MDALVPAFVLALLAGWDGTGQRLAAHLVRVGGGRGAVLAGLALGCVLVAGIAAFGGVLAKPYVVPRAAQLILAVALVFAGFAAFGQGERPGVRDWPAGAFVTAVTSLVAYELPGSAAFFAFAMAVGSPHPALVATGIAVGSFAAVAAGALAILPTTLLRPARWAIGVLFLLAGAVTALTALRLL